MDADDTRDEPDRRIPGWGFVPEVPATPTEQPPDGASPPAPPAAPDPDPDSDGDADGPAIPGWGPGVTTGPAPMESPFPLMPPTEWPERIVAPQAHRAARPARSATPVVAAAVVVAVLLLVGLVSVLQSDDEPAQVAATTAPPTTLPPAVPVPLEDVFDDLVAFVEQERESSFVAAPTAVVADDAEYERTLDGWLVRDRIELDERSLQLQALGVLEPDQDLFAMVREWRVASSHAAYDPVSGELIVRGDEVTPAGRIELVRALAAALDDEAYTLDRTPAPDADPEVALAFQLVAERVAHVVGDRYLATLGEEDRSAAERELEATRAAWLARVPESVATLELASERAAELVDEQFAAGAAAVDQLVVEPPTTVEQAFSPDAFAERRVPFAVGVSAGATAPEAFARFTPLDLNAMGIDPLADESWAGGQFTRSTVEGRACMQFRVLGADDGATRALHVQVALWADRTNAIVRRVYDQIAGREVVDGLRCD